MKTGLKLQNSCNNKQHSFGFTLIELTVVLLILIALAGLAIPYISGTNQAALCRATDVSMQNIKKAIMERYYLDTLGNFPKSTKAGSDYNLKYLFEHPANAASGGWDDFDPQTQIGWRTGGYLQGGIKLSSELVSQWSNSFQDDSTKVHDKILAEQSQILDGWGRPVVIQVPSDCSKITKVATANCARLVSAGIDGNIDTPLSENRKNDDRVLYLEIPTPVNNGADNTENTSDDNTVNRPCDEN